MAKTGQPIASLPAEAHTAVPTVAGFEYQFERMLYYLATSSYGTIVGIETDDDVTFTKSGITTLEQNKFVIKPSKNPFTNTSENLWKTLLIWINCVKRSPGANYRFLFTTNSAISRKPSSLVWKIANANSKAETKKCLAALKTAKNSTREKIAKIMDQVKNCDDAILEQVIINASIVDNAKMQDSELIDAIEPPDGINGADLLITMRGWVHSVVMNNWASGKAGLVGRQQYINAKDRHCETQKRFRKLERPYRDIVVSEEDRISCISKIFIEQILAIKLPSEEIADDEIKNAIECYLRFYAENSRLLEEGEITDHEWDVFFDALKQRWKSIHNRNMSKFQQIPSLEGVGRDIYFDTLAADYKEVLAGQETTEKYLTNGGYHMLADDNTVRWHPNFSMPKQLEDHE